MSGLSSEPFSARYPRCLPKLFCNLPFFLLSTVLDVQWLDIPDTIRILLDTSVTREEAHPGHTRDTLAEPFILVLVCRINQVVCLQVAMEVVRDQIVVAVLDDAADER